MNDSERIAKATRKGNLMHGPAERQRCAKHRTRWEIYCWVWRVPEDGDHLSAITDGEPERVRACSLCNAESEAEDASYV
jgi:hypothetical protein